MNLFNMLDDASEYAKELEERLQDAIAAAEDTQRELDGLKLNVSDADKLLCDAFHACATGKTTKAEGLIHDAIYTLCREIM